MPLNGLHPGTVVSPGPAILALQRFPEAVEAALGRRYDVRQWPVLAGEERGVFPNADAIRGIVTGGVKGASRTVMERLPNLEIVAVCGVGTDAVDLGYARERRLQVTITPDVLTDDVADLAFGLLLAAARGIASGDHFVRDGRWASRPPLALATKVSGKRLGIVGLGHIGRAIARRAAGFDMILAYHGPREHAGLPYRYVSDVVELARHSDFLVVAASGGSATRHLIGRAALDALGPRGVLVNVARGSIVDESELIAALRERRLGAAGLDVFADEPHVSAELRTLENVVLSPHRGSATGETRLAMGNAMIANLDAFFSGLRPPGSVL